MFPSDSRSKLFVDCFAAYNPEKVKYDVFTNWSIDDPIATEAARINGYFVRIRAQSHFSSLIVKETNVRQNAISYFYESFE